MGKGREGRMEKRGGKGGEEGEGRVAPLSEILNTPLCPPHCFRPGDAPGGNGHKTTSGQISIPKFEIPMGCFLFEYEFWQRFCQDLYVFCAKKNCFHNAKFSEFGDIGGADENFLTKPPKRHILA